MIEQVHAVFAQHPHAAPLIGHVQVVGDRLVIDRTVQDGPRDQALSVIDNTYGQVLIDAAWAAGLSDWTLAKTDDEVAADLVAAQAAQGIPAALRGWSYTRTTLHAGEGLPEPTGPRQAPHRRRLVVTDWNGQAAVTMRDLDLQAGGWGALFGPVGVGKSTLMAAAVNDAISCGLRVFWTTEAQFYDQAWSRTPGFWARVRSADVVALDDLGTARVSDAHRSTLERLICERYDDDRALVLTSNLPMAAAGRCRSIVQTYGDRLASRLRHRTTATAITVVGPSWRG